MSISKTCSTQQSPSDAPKTTTHAECAPSPPSANARQKADTILHHFDITEKYLAMGKNIQIHNSSVEFLIFQLERKEDGIEVLYQDKHFGSLKMPYSWGKAPNGKIVRTDVSIAKNHLNETESEKYRIIQDKMFQSDFDYWADFDYWGTNILPDFE